MPHVQRFLLLLVLAGAGHADGLKVRYVDVGQGDSILIHGPSSAWLIDGGPPGQKVAAAIQAAMAEEGVQRLDGILLSHPHLDHFGGLETLIDTVPVGRVLHNLDVPSTTYRRFTDELVQRGIPYEKVHVGPLDWGPGLTVTVLGAKAQEDFDLRLARVAGRQRLSLESLAEQLIDDCGLRSADRELDINSYSVVVRVEHEGKSFLFTGDAPGELEDELVRAGKIKPVQVLKVSHHGSKYSSTTDFLDAADPDEAVIQLGEGNRYGHPHREAIRRLQGAEIRAWRNDLNGLVKATVSGMGALVIQPSRP